MRRRDRDTERVRRDSSMHHSRGGRPAKESTRTKRSKAAKAEGWIARGANREPSRGTTLLACACISRSLSPCSSTFVARFFLCTSTIVHTVQQRQRQHHTQPSPVWTSAQHRRRHTYSLTHSQKHSLVSLSISAHLSGSLTFRLGSVLDFCLLAGRSDNFRNSQARTHSCPTRRTASSPDTAEHPDLSVINPPAATLHYLHVDRSSIIDSLQEGPAWIWHALASYEPHPAATIPQLTPPTRQQRGTDADLAIARTLRLASSFVDAYSFRSGLLRTASITIGIADRRADTFIVAPTSLPSTPLVPNTTILAAPFVACTSPTATTHRQSLRMPLPLSRP